MVLKKGYLLLTLVLVIFIGTKSTAQTRKIQSGIVYYFTQYMKWPDQKQKGDFNIYVVGNDEILTHIQSMAKEKQSVGSQQIVVKNVASIGEVLNAHIVILSKNSIKDFSLATEKAQSDHFLLVTSQAGYGKKGAGINLVVKNGKPGYEINEQVISKCGLKAGSKLITLGYGV